MSTSQTVGGVAKIVTHFAPFKYSIMDFDNGFTGSTLAFMGDTIPITIVDSTPIDPPSGDVGIMVKIVAGVVTLYVWDGTAWRAKS